RWHIGEKAPLVLGRHAVEHKACEDEAQLWMLDQEAPSAGQELPPLARCQTVVDERNDVSLFVGEVLVQPSPEVIDSADDWTANRGSAEADHDATIERTRAMQSAISRCASAIRVTSSSRVAARAMSFGQITS